LKTLKDPAVRAEFRHEVAVVALGEVGQHEDPPRSNRTKYGRWYGLQAQWCGIYVSWVYATAAHRVGCENPLAGIQTKKGFARVTTTYPRARLWKIVLAKGEVPMVGDVMIWSKGRLGALVGANGHTGVVTRVLPDGSFDVTEGNTDGAYSRTGGNVMTHRHRVADGRHGHLLAIYRPTRRYGRA
jgi:hypothetical protein